MAGKPKKATPTPRARSVKARKNTNQDKYYKWACDNLDTIKDWAMQGHSFFKMSKLMGVTPNTVYRWSNVHPEFAMAVAEGIDAGIQEVEAALYKRALGYDVPFEEETKTSCADGQSITTKKHIKHIPPETKAIEFFLKNMKGDKWNKSSADVTVSGGVLVVPQSEREEWAQQVAEAQQKLQESADDEAKKLLR